MATRSLVVFKKGRKYFCTYCHFDGYFEGVGHTLAESFPTPEAARFLTQFQRVSFISSGFVAPYISSLMESSTVVEGSHGLAESISRSHADYVYVYDSKAERWFGARTVELSRSQRIFQRIKKESEKEYEPALLKTKKTSLLNIFSILSQDEDVFVFSEKKLLSPTERRELSSLRQGALPIIVEEAFIRSVVSFARSSENPEKWLENLIRLLDERPLFSLKESLLKELLKAVPEKVSFSLTAEVLRKPQKRKVL